MSFSRNILGVVTCVFFIASQGLILILENETGLSSCPMGYSFIETPRCGEPKQVVRDQYFFNQVYESQQVGEIFVKATLNGSGIYIPFDGQSYKGELRNESFEGEGNLIFPDGSRYHGLFKRGEYHGPGTLYDTYGEVLVSGIWNEGNLVGAKNRQ